jgi:hypothetical protein
MITQETKQTIQELLFSLAISVFAVAAVWAVLEMMVKP